ncbi:MAG: hypothetical protein BWY06_00887 [Candidatus Latescibacteria bacterium ADurb.Bin168]|nr:MAG: hypothetical protein BWY06_00887 [Candidatus Latescibacteria bacterium ADurb.Bin168]
MVPRQPDEFRVLPAHLENRLYLGVKISDCLRNRTEFVDGCKACCFSDRIRADSRQTNEGNSFCGNTGRHLRDQFLRGLPRASEQPPVPAQNDHPPLRDAFQQEVLIVLVNQSPHQIGVFAVGDEREFDADRANIKSQCKHLCVLSSVALRDRTSSPFRQARVAKRGHHEGDLRVFAYELRGQQRGQHFVLRINCN